MIRSHNTSSSTLSSPQPSWHLYIFTILIKIFLQQRSAKSDPEPQHLGTSFPLSASDESAHPSCWDASKGPDNHDYDYDHYDDYDDCGCQDCKSGILRGRRMVYSWPDAHIWGGFAQCTLLMRQWWWRWWGSVTISFRLQRFRGLYDSSSNSGFESSSDLRDILIAAVDFSIHKVCIVTGVVIVVLVAIAIVTERYPHCCCWLFHP